MASHASNIQFEDETIQCCNCDRTFVYTAEMQKRHQDKGYQNKPKRCVNCKNKRNGPRRGNGSRGNDNRRQTAGLSYEKLTEKELLIEIGKSVGALRVYMNQQFNELRKRLDRIENDLFVEDNDEG